MQRASSSFRGLGVSQPGGPGRGARLPCEERPASTAGATAVPWLDCGELPALGSGSR